MQRKKMMMSESARAPRCADGATFETAGEVRYRAVIVQKYEGISRPDDVPPITG
jgi:hypothetical protein